MDALKVRKMACCVEDNLKVSCAVGKQTGKKGKTKLHKVRVRKNNQNNSQEIEGVCSPHVPITQAAFPNCTATESLCMRKAVDLRSPD